MRAIGYVRVSTEDQAQAGVSLDAQEQRIRAFCQAKDWSLVALIRDEGASAKNLHRPGMQEILASCRKKAFDVVVVLKLDRLTRSVRDLGFLVEDVFAKHGVAFCSLQDSFDTSTANGRMVMNLLATVAQWERDIISERTKGAMAFMKASLRRVGAVPFGFDLSGKYLTPNEEETQTLKMMSAWREEGLSYQAIADKLNVKGLTAKNGGKWYSKTVRGALRRLQEQLNDPLVMESPIRRRKTHGNENRRGA